MCVLIPIFVIGLMVVLGISGFRYERTTWNNGICKANGLPWKHFDIDSQGGHGYKAGDETCWISWPGVIKK